MTGSPSGKMAKMKVIIKRPDEEYGHMTNISGSLKNLQKTVDGWIEAVPIRDDLVIICNEEGKILGLPKNLKIPHDIVCGTIIVVGVSGDDFCDIPIVFDEWKEMVDGWKQCG